MELACTMPFFNIKERNFDMIDIEEAKHIAELSKLTFDDREIEKLTEDMQDIISLMDSVKEAIHIEREEIPIEYNKLREDEAKKSEIKEEKNITVPRIV